MKGPFRLFGSTRDREHSDLRSLYELVRTREPQLAKLRANLITFVEEEFAPFPRDLSRELSVALRAVIAQERYLSPLPPSHIGSLDMRQELNLHNLLNQKRYVLEHEDAVAELLYDRLLFAFVMLARELPTSDEPSPFSIPIMYALPRPREAIDHIFATFVADELFNQGLLMPLYDQLRANKYRAVGREPDDGGSRPLVSAKESKLPLRDLPDTYLVNTPFHRLYTMTLPLRLSRDDRMNHTHVVGGSGSGKTSLIENLLLHDLQSSDPPSLVVVDPHSDLIQRLTHADLGLSDRLVLIDPRDTRHFPALNIFALNARRMAGYDEATREQVTAGAIQTLEYLFEGFDIELTGKQQVLFRSVCRLMLSLPDAMGRNATIVDMTRLMSDAAPYKGAIDRLPPIQKDFFTYDFPSPAFKQTREQVRYRLQAIMDNPTLARLFTSPETKVDLFAELNRGSVILVDTAKDFLKDGSAIFGRLFISLVLQAVMERAAIAERRRKDTFLFVDEAASYFSSNIDDLLTDARKYRCGCLFAHQYLAQATPALQASLAANTSIKFASGLSAQDANRMAPEMRTSSDFILSQPRLQFAAHIRNVTAEAVSVPITPGALDRLPKLSSHAYEALISESRRRVSIPPGAAPERRPPSDEAEPDEDISENW